MCESSWHTGFSRTGCMGKNTKNEFYVIISLQVVGFSQNLVGMFYSMIPMQCPSQNSKFENFRHFIGGIIVVTTNGGGCCTAHWRAWLGMIEKRIFRFFSFITRGKEKTAHIRKNFWKIFKKSLENQFFPTLRYNTPPIRTQTIKAKNRPF